MLTDSWRLETSLVIEQVTFGGKGLGRLPDGKVCFVPKVIPGERVTVKLGKQRASYAEAEVTEILEASPDRVNAKCPVYGRCGGCQYQHMVYPRQLEIKTAQVADALRRLGGIKNPNVEPTIGSPQEFHYRNRISVHVRQGHVGFYSEQSHRIVEVSECSIASPHVNEMLKELIHAKPVDGEYPLREPGNFRGFRQVNESAAELLRETVFSLAQPGGALLVDAYCGAGFFSRRLVAIFPLVIGIEWSQGALRAARAGGGGSEIYLLGDVKRHLAPSLAAAKPEETTLLVDPPAEGMDPEILQTILDRRPARIIYVSCNPATLARDIKRLGSGYALSRATPIDMFPQTAEIEVAALLERI